MDLVLHHMQGCRCNNEKHSETDEPKDGCYRASCPAARKAPWPARGSHFAMVTQGGIISRMSRWRMNELSLELSRSYECRSTMSTTPAASRSVLKTPTLQMSCADCVPSVATNALSVAHVLR